MTIVSPSQLVAISSGVLKGVIFDGNLDTVIAGQEFADNGLILVSDGTNTVSVANVDAIVFNGQNEIGEFPDRSLYVDLTTGNSFVMTAVLMAVEDATFD